jgi:glycosyltransferase involved in cell wall biosynthesis
MEPVQTVKPDLSIVVPAYNEEANLAVFLKELGEALQAAGVGFEVLFVDDGSRDRTPDILRQLAASHENVRAIILSRNFGHQAAVSVGLRYARGAAVAVMDADLQDRPSDLVQLYRRFLDGADVVYAVRRSRPENLFKRFAYSVFYRVLARLASIPIPIDSGDFCIMSADFATHLNQLPERLRYVRGLRAWIGGRQVSVAVDRDARRAGKPKYTLVKLCRLAIDGLISFSYTPLRFASMLGFAISGMALIGFVVVLTWRIMGLLPAGAGVATIALAVFFIGGVQLLTLGILGEYVGRIFDEVKARPVAVVREIVGDHGHQER